MNRVNHNKKLSLNPLSLLAKIFETIGRTTYQSIFKLFYLIGFLVLQLIKLPFKFKIPSFPQVKIKLPKLTFRPKLKLPKPKFKFPKLKFPKLKLPQLKLPKISFKLPKKLPSLKPFKLTPLKALIYFLIFLTSFAFYLLILKDLPKPTELTTRQPTLSTKIYDRHGTLLFTFYKDQNRSLISLSDIPNHFKLATLAIEDSDFYNHKGLSWSGIIRSLKQIILNQELQGGSTITQQLIKNALLTPERTLQRKIKELVLALEVEFLFSKDEILEMYFNEVSYGGTAYGVEQAAQTYFAKSIKDINLAEAALLAGLPASPTTYSPFGSNPYLAIKGQHQVLNRLVEEQYIAPLEADLAKQQKIRLAPQYTNIKAPHFVM